MRSRAPLEVVRRRWRWVAVMALLGVVAGLCYSLYVPKTYRASASVFFSLQYGDSASDLVQGSTYTQNQVASFARLATTPAVLEPVIDELGLDTGVNALASRIEASAPLDTVLVEVTVTDRSAEGSARIANAVVDTLSTTVENLAPRNDNGRPTVEATTVAPAEVPGGPAAPKPPLNVAVGLGIGLLVGLALAWTREALDNRVRDASVVSEVTDLPVIGSIGTRSRASQPVVIESEPHSPQADFFRQLATNLQFLGVPGANSANGRDLRTVMVTSSVPAEGKSTVAANLAAALAESNARVVLVDADLRRPATAQLLGIEGAAGLSTVLIGRATIDDVLQEWGTSGLHVLASGRVPPNSGELLNSPAMRQVLAELRQRFDFVVLDAPPLLPVADAVILSRAVDGAIVVANVTKVRRHQLAESLRSLEQVKARVLGVVLNQVRRRDPSYSYEPYGGDVEWAPAAEEFVAGRAHLTGAAPAAPGNGQPAAVEPGRVPTATGAGEGPSGPSSAPHGKDG
ncbi:polysaccharide biosynthesis tyrosine autokinase [Blastococcus litoris]|uniref:polysaccharide biosynthesis tyrosine autokinase n=1 Tax=Blastococcus litoris TaxID=2171622 RepID=UPI000E300781|nr:polysaccharide biosynthesis tyrosine autokinase [Blastococcus litoris]